MNPVPSNQSRVGICVLTAAFVVAVGVALPLAICPRLRGGDAWEDLAWALVGPWLATALSLVPGRDAPMPIALVPALALLSSLCGVVFMSNLHYRVLAVALFANVLVLAAAGTGQRRYHVRLVASCIGGASLAALHVWALCGGAQSEPATPAVEAPAPGAETPAEPSPAEGGTKRPSLTAQGCEAGGGSVVVDIGDGAIHKPEYKCASGAAPSGSIRPDEGGAWPSKVPCAVPSDA